MSAGPPPPSRDRLFIERALRLGIIASAVLAVLLVLLWVLKSALTPLAVAFVLAYLFDPLIDRFEARRVPRDVAIFLLLGLAGVTLLAAAGWLVPRMQAELVGLSESLPRYLDRAFAWLSPRLEQFGFEMPRTIREGIERLREGQLESLFATARDLLGRVVTFFAGTFGALVSLLVIPVIAYYLLVEFDRLKAAMLKLVPDAYQPLVERQAGRIDRLVAGFIRGQLVVAGIQGVLYGIGFAWIGIDLAAVIGLVAGMLSIIPYVGGAVAIGIASLMCVLEFGLDLHLLLVVGWYALVQSFEGMVLTPRIVGRSVGMHPVTVIVALLIGGDLLGFLGLLVAVPVAAVVQVFAQDAVQAWKASEAYSRS